MATASAATALSLTSADLTDGPRSAGYAAFLHCQLVPRLRQGQRSVSRGAERNRSVRQTLCAPAQQHDLWNCCLEYRVCSMRLCQSADAGRNSCQPSKERKTDSSGWHPIAACENRKKPEHSHYKQFVLDSLGTKSDFKPRLSPARHCREEVRCVHCVLATSQQREELQPNKTA